MMDRTFLQHCVETAVKVLSRRPSALISDIDGTLSPIVATPEDAVVLPECRSALQALAGRVDVVAVISGRAADKARRMVGLDELLYVGNHGLERWDAQSGYRNDASAFEAEIRDLQRRLKEELQGTPEIDIEDKGVVLSLHYRSSPQFKAARRDILVLLDRLLPSRQFSIAEGKKVIEVRPPLAIDKGTIVSEIVRERRLRGVVFLGDDVTDVDAMRALRRLRDGSNVSALLIGVGGDEMPEALSTETDVLLPGPEAVAEFLTGLANALTG